MRETFFKFPQYLIFSSPFFVVSLYSTTLLSFLFLPDCDTRLSAVILCAFYSAWFPGRTLPLSSFSGHFSLLSLFYHSVTSLFPRKRSAVWEEDSGEVVGQFLCTRCGVQTLPSSQVLPRFLFLMKLPSFRQGV